MDIKTPYENLKEGLLRASCEEGVWIGSKLDID